MNTNAQLLAQAKTQLADEVVESMRLIGSKFDVAAEQFEMQPDDVAAEQLGRAAWMLCEQLRETLLRQEPAEDWAVFLTSVEDMKDIARDWIETATVRQAAGHSHPRTVSQMRRNLLPASRTRHSGSGTSIYRPTGPKLSFPRQ